MENCRKNISSNINDYNRNSHSKCKWKSSSKWSKSIKRFSATLTLNNCTYSYYYGTARPTTSPSSDAYFNWTMKATDVTAATIAAGYIRNMSTTRYSSTSSYRYAVNGTYKFIYKINNSSYNGTIQATNSTTTTVL